MRQARQKTKKISEDRNKKNTDKVEFSNAAKAAVGISAASAKSRSEALTAAKDPASPEKTAALKAAVESGGYFVRSEDIASSILGF